ncbi:MAG: helix-hairpin-helix domain-containing protein [Gemmatimonadota bacterium]
MDKHAIALVLEEIGTLLELHGENTFKARAFQSAARAIESVTEDVVQLARRGELETVPGIGSATARVIRELIDTGTARYYLDLRARTPSGFYELLAVPKLGPRKIRLLHEQLGIDSVADLERAARAGQIAQLKGFGGRTEELLLEGIAYVRGTLGRRRLADALEVGPRLLGFVSSLPGVIEAELAGELRRKLETVDGVSIVAAVDPADIDAVLAAFSALPGISNAQRAHGNTASARLSDGFQLRLRCCPPAEFGATVITETGSADHVRALGADVAAVRGSEIHVYESSGLRYIEPELRETGAEVEAARRGELPQLVTLADLRGCFHCHTVYSDGRGTIEEMARAAQQRKWRYLGIADHSQNASYAGGLRRDDVERQHAEIDEWNAQHGSKVWLFKGIEADILNDGRLDYEDEEGLLESFDFVIGSIHSSFALPESGQTARLLRAMQNPNLTFIGHMTGRLLLSRAGYRVDVDAVLEAAALVGVAIEINADPHRLDLDWRHWPGAKRRGVKTAINPDAHSARSLDVVEYGVCMARKGWLEPDDVVNTWTLPRVRQFFKARKK